MTHIIYVREFSKHIGRFPDKRCLRIPLCGRRERFVIHRRTTSASTAPRTPRRTCCSDAYVLNTVPRFSRSCEHFPEGFELHLLHDLHQVLGMRVEGTGVKELGFRAVGMRFPSASNFFSITSSTNFQQHGLRLNRWRPFASNLCSITGAPRP